MTTARGTAPPCGSSSPLTRHKGAIAAGNLDEWLLPVLFLLALYVLARLSLVLPRTAIDQRPTLQGSWRLSRSNGWRLAVVLLPLSRSCSCSCAQTRPAATDQALVADKSPAAAGQDGGRLVKHARYYWLLLAEGHLTRRLFGDMLRRIWALPVPAG